MDKTSDAPIFEVFFQDTALSFATHVGSVRAPSHQSALEMARETFFRRHAAFDIWVVPQRFIAHARCHPDLLPDHPEEKTYRLARGYDNAPAWRRFKSATQSIEDVQRDLAREESPHDDP